MATPYDAAIPSNSIDDETNELENSLSQPLPPGGPSLFLDAETLKMTKFVYYSFIVLEGQFPFWRKITNLNGEYYYVNRNFKLKSSNRYETEGGIGDKAVLFDDSIGRMGKIPRLNIVAKSQGGFIKDRKLYDYKASIPKNALEIHFSQLQQPQQQALYQYVSSQYTKFKSNNPNNGNNSHDNQRLFEMPGCVLLDGQSNCDNEPKFAADEVAKTKAELQRIINEAAPKYNKNDFVSVEKPKDGSKASDSRSDAGDAKSVADQSQPVSKYPRGRMHFPPDLLTLTKLYYFSVHVLGEQRCPIFEYPFSQLGPHDIFVFGYFKPTPNTVSQNEYRHDINNTSAYETPFSNFHNQLGVKFFEMIRPRYALQVEEYHLGSKARNMYGPFTLYQGKVNKAELDKFYALLSPKQQEALQRYVQSLWNKSQDNLASASKKPIQSTGAKLHLEHTFCEFPGGFTLLKGESFDPKISLKEIQTSIQALISNHISLWPEARRQLIHLLQNPEAQLQDAGDAKAGADNNAKSDNKSESDKNNVEPDKNRDNAHGQNQSVVSSGNNPAGSSSSHSLDHSSGQSSSMLNAYGMASGAEQPSSNNFNNANANQPVVTSSSFLMRCFRRCKSKVS